MVRPRNDSASLAVETLTHEDATRKNIPTAEYQSVMQKDERSPVRVAYARRKRDLDPQLMWRGKEQQDWSNLVVNAPPLYIQEKVHPKALIDDLRRQSEARAESADAQPDPQFSLFADFNGLPDDNTKTEFHRHDGHWSNRKAWATLNSDTSRPLDKPTSGRIAVKVINHLGDEVMKVFRV